jgi:hypothetical protein
MSRIDGCRIDEERVDVRDREAELFHGNISFKAIIKLKVSTAILGVHD